MASENFESEIKGIEKNTVEDADTKEQVKAIPSGRT